MAGNATIHPRRFKFFRVLLPGFTSKLSLPQHFIKYFVQQSSTWATLLSPLGRSWHVHVHGDGRTLNFEDGWEKFIEDHKLSVGDFLVFNHKGSLIFDVTIFDPSTCERDYTADNLTCGVTHENVPSREKIPGREEDNVKEFEGCGKHAPSSCCKRAVEPMEHAVSSKRRPSGEKELKEHKRSVTVPDAMKSANRRQQFEIVVGLFQHQRYCVEIPAAFKASINDLSSISQLFLKNPKGEMWPTKVRHWCGRSKIQDGWREFCVANELEDGDVCVFELEEENVLRVQIHRRGLPIHRRGHRPMKHPVSCADNLTCGVTHKNIPSREKIPVREEDNVKESEASSCCKRAVEPMEPAVSSKRRPPGEKEFKEHKRSVTVPDNTKRANNGQQFEIVVGLFQHQRYCVEIPAALKASMNDLPSISQLFLKNPKGEMWPTKVRHWCKRSGIRSRIQDGWREFCVTNELEDGDVCVFELEEKNVLRVQIHRRGGLLKHGREGHTHMKLLLSCGDLKAGQVLRVAQEQKPHTCEDKCIPCPCFMTKVPRPAGLRNGYLVRTS